MTVLNKTNGKYYGTAHFVRKAYDLKVLLNERERRNNGRTTPQNFVIEKIIDLNLIRYEGFCMDFAATQIFIEENRDLMYMDENGIWHCILVRAEPIDPENMDGVLVEAEGYSWSRYAAALGDSARGTFFE